MPNNTTTASATPDSHPPAVSTPAQKTTRAAHGYRGYALVITFMVMISVIFGYLIYWQTQQIQHLTATAWKQEQQQDAITQQIQQLTQTNTKDQSQLQQLNLSLTQTRDELARVRQGDTNIWIIAQADFLVQLAGRKLWLERDVGTALLLLQEADRMLNSLHEANIIPIRALIHQDIATLTKIPTADIDGIVFQLTQLLDDVDNLRVADDSLPQAPMDQNSEAMTASLNDWRENIRNSWRQFIKQFISIQPRDQHTPALLTPDQIRNLRDNLRSQLLISIQATLRQQEATYQQALDTLMPWIRANFAMDDPTTEQFIAKLEHLAEQPIQPKLPSVLQSQEPLQQLLNQRSRHRPITDTP